jgi:hypothetical protein
MDGTERPYVPGTVHESKALKGKLCHFPAVDS